MLLRNNIFIYLNMLDLADLSGEELQKCHYGASRITYFMSNNVKALYGTRGLCCYETVILAFEKYDIYRFMCDEVHNNFNLSLSTMKTSKNPIKNVVPYLSDYLKTSKKFTLHCISFCPNIIFKLDHHMNNELLLLEVITYEPSYIKFFHYKFRDDIDFAVKCTLKNPECYQYLEEHIRHDPQLIYHDTAFENNNNINCCFPPFDSCYN